MILLHEINARQPDLVLIEESDRFPQEIVEEEAKDYFGLYDFRWAPRILATASTDIERHPKHTILNKTCVNVIQVLRVIQAAWVIQPSTVRGASVIQVVQVVQVVKGHMGRRVI